MKIGASSLIYCKIFYESFNLLDFSLCSFGSIDALTPFRALLLTQIP